MPAAQLKLDPPPRVAVFPLGTGNDLSLSFGWGNAFLPSWLRNFASVYNMLRRVADAQPRELDCWRITMSAGDTLALLPWTHTQAQTLLPGLAGLAGLVAARCLVHIAPGDAAVSHAVYRT